MEWWKKLTPEQLRWAAIGIGALFLVALLLSDFFRLLDLRGGAYALDRAELKLGLLNPTEGIRPIGEAPNYLIDIPVKVIAAVASLAIVALLFVATQRRRSSN